MKFFLIFSSLNLLIFHAHLLKSERIKRIVNGSPAVAGQCPSAIITDVDNDLRCGATIVAANYLLTTADCAEAFDDVSEIGVHVGLRLPAKGEAKFSNVDWYRIHPDYDSSELRNNIAILHVSESLPLNDDLKAVCVSSRAETPHDTTAQFCGYGVTNYTTTNRVLHSAHFNVIRLDSCKQILTDPAPSSGDLCTLTSGKTTCAGDQGGPLILKRDSRPDLLIGISSWSTCDIGAANVFVDVSRYHEWIRNNTESVCFSE